ncbi:MAG: outer membrane beta-barrel protein [Sphingobacteriales bacterium]|nr:outer membrane beta-barrel protein [Sphingobacteriales bacterium]
MVPFAAIAQLRNNLNLENHDSKKIRFGINAGVNKSYFNFAHNPLFLTQDSITAIESVNNYGVNLAWLLNLNLSQHFDLRTYPINLTFAERAFEYSMKTPDPARGEKPITTKRVQSIVLSLPVQIKFSSDRINNFKVYTIAGGRVDYDLNSTNPDKNDGSSATISLNKINYSVEGGIGFHFYFPYFVLSPELKLGWGLSNLHNRNLDSKFSAAIDKISSRMLSFSLTIE